MSDSRLAVRFSDFKWSDKVAMQEFEANDPSEFCNEIIGFVLNSSGFTETDSYRLQMLGEFVGQAMTEGSVSKIRTKISESAAITDSGLPSEAPQQFVNGLDIGVGLKTTRGDVYSQHSGISVVHPD